MKKSVHDNDDHDEMETIRPLAWLVVVLDVLVLPQFRGAFASR